MYINKTRSIHSDRLERWLGKERINELSRYITEGGGKGNPWYGPPINIRDVPGSVWIGKDGDFVGDFDRGFFHTAMDSFFDYTKRVWKEIGKPIYAQENPTLGTGFASISDALSRASSGFQQLLNGNVQKVGPTGVANIPSTLWRLGNAPAAGAAGSAAPGGRVPDKTTTGAMAFNNPASGTLHLTGADMSASVASNALMLYDRIFDVAKTMNSSATESVTGAPTRYQSSVTTNPDYAGGNFLFIEVGGTALAATAHNWTVCLYRNQAGTDNTTLPSVTGASGAIVDRFDMPANAWFCPLATGDSGIMDLAQMQCSALVATGAVNFVIGHPIGIMAFPIAILTTPFDWLTNKYQAPRIFSDACLALIELPKPSTAATTYSGIIYANNAA
jgi:hypothetical protein